MRKEKDLFLKSGCKALIIGASGAIGSALALNLESIIGFENVAKLSRRDDGLDFFKPETVGMLAEKQNGPFHLIIDATGALDINNFGPEKSFKSLTEEIFVNQFRVNAIGPALLIKHFMKYLPRTGKVVFVTLSARVGSIEDNLLGGWISYRASKAALNQIIKTAAIEASRRNTESLFMAVHPGTVSSKLTKKYLGSHKFVQPDEAAKNILRVVEQKDYTDTGSFFAYDGTAIPY